MLDNDSQVLYPYVWEREEDQEKIQKFTENYKLFLNTCKTERESAAKIAALAHDAGFKNLDDCIADGKKLKKGDKIYAIRRNKAAALFVIGERPLKDGLHLIAAHIDSPRLDVRANPLYENEGISLFKTHYYGGIKKYQWATIPLALHGIVVKKNGERIKVVIGEEENDPVFYISDLPKHLSAEQSKKTMAEGIMGEDLNIIVGSIPLSEDGKKAGQIRKNILRLLKERYSISEKDFTSAELEIVPAGKARDVGFDRSMIASYGHDDRICSYTALMGLLDSEQHPFTGGVLFVDKEEVGNPGGCGMDSHYMENLISKIVSLTEETGPMTLRLALENSKMLSADVGIAYDSSYPEAFEPSNTARLGRGPAIVKYAGHMGKKGCNDASAEYLAMIRDIFDNADVYWQTGEYGKIDFGGGGTIAPFAASYGMEVVDCGVVLLSMHAPYELASKADIYETYRAYRAFLESGFELRQYM